jgi:nucleoside-diphosphate-sugar epimerase
LLSQWSNAQVKAPTIQSDALAEDSPLLASICGASVAGRIATGGRAGRRVQRLRNEPADDAGDIRHAADREQRAAIRRDGAARLVADASRACAHLGWRPRYPSLDTILEHAWAWEQRRHKAG